MAPTVKPAVNRYHPVITLLHWVLTIMITGSLTLGFFRIAPMANSDPQKIALLRVHMIVGVVILGLTIVRLLVRLYTSKPPAASPNQALDQFATLAHYAFYLLVVLMATTGIATAFLAGLGMIAFGDGSAALPPSFLIYPPRVAHGLIAIALAALIALHVIAALYHQFVLRDGIFARIWFGKR